ncbi:hypothetical protein ACWD1W_37930 [Streptomyces olivaceoviridis]
MRVEDVGITYPPEGTVNMPGEPFGVDTFPHRASGVGTMRNVIHIEE